jgi:hypothetical protein
MGALAGAIGPPVGAIYGALSASPPEEIERATHTHSKQLDRRPPVRLSTVATPSVPNSARARWAEIRTVVGVVGDTDAHPPTNIRKAMTSATRSSTWGPSIARCASRANGQANCRYASREVGFVQATQAVSRETQWMLSFGDLLTTRGRGLTSVSIRGRTAPPPQSVPPSSRPRFLRAFSRSSVSDVRTPSMPGPHVHGDMVTWCATVSRDELWSFALRAGAPL